MEALVTGLYNTGPYVPDALRPSGLPPLANVVIGAPEHVFLQYDAGTGNVVMGALDVTVSSMLIQLNGLAGAIILAELPAAVAGPFGVVTNSKLFFGGFGMSITAVNFGAAFIAGLSQEIVLDSLRIRGTLADGGPGSLTSVTLIYIPT